MTELFLRLVRISLSASWLVLLVVGLRLLLRHWPRWVFPILWSLVGIRLLLPVSILSRFSLVPQMSSVPIGEHLQTDTTPSGTPFAAIACLIWAAVAVALLLYGLFSYLLLRRKLRTAIRQEDRIYRSEYVRSPFILGIITPRIYLPFHLSQDDSVHVIAHEEAHIRRRDHWLKPAAFVLLAAYWFNPLLWLAYYLLCRDIELACDERVIQNMTEGQRAAYSQTLLTCTANRALVPACPLSFGSSGIGERVRSVLAYKKAKRWVALAAMVLVLVLGLCFLTDRAAPQRRAPAAPPQIQLTAPEQTEPPAPNRRIANELLLLADRIWQEEEALRKAEIQEEADQRIAERLPVIELPSSSVVLTAEKPRQDLLCDAYPEIRDAQIQILLLLTEESTLPRIVVLNNLYNH